MRLLEIKNNIDNYYQKLDIYAQICSNTYCAREYTTEQCFGRNTCVACGNALQLKREVQKDLKKYYENKEKADGLIDEMEQFIVSIENLSFPSVNRKEGESDQEVKL